MGEYNLDGTLTESSLEALGDWPERLSTPEGARALGSVGPVEKEGRTFYTPEVYGPNYLEKAVEETKQYLEEMSEDTGSVDVRGYE